MALRTMSESSKDTLFLLFRRLPFASLINEAGRTGPVLSRWQLTPSTVTGPPGRPSGRGSFWPKTGVPCAMRVAAVQTTAGADRDGTSKRPLAWSSWPPTRGRRWSFCPSSSPSPGDPTISAATPRATDGPTVTWASELAARRRIHLVAGSLPRAGRRWPASSTPAACSVRAARWRRSTARSISSTWSWPSTEFHESATFAAGHELCVAPLAGPNATPSGRARPLALLRPPVPRDLPRHDVARCHRHRRALGVHRGHRAGPLAAASAGPGDRKPDLCGRCRTGGPPSSGHARLSRPLHDRRPLG